MFLFHYNAKFISSCHRLLYTFKYNIELIILSQCALKSISIYIQCIAKKFIHNKNQFYIKRINCNIHMLIFFVSFNE